MKKLSALILAAFLIFTVSACDTTEGTSQENSQQENKPTVQSQEEHVHNFSPATCTEPEKCTCGETRGEALGHDWAPATCQAPKTCKRCGATEGSKLKHTLGTKGFKCKVCGGDIYSSDYDYLAASDYRTVKRKYSEAAPLYAKVHLFQNRHGDYCVLVDLHFKIIDNYQRVVLYNLSQGTMMEDPVNALEREADKYFGAQKISLIDDQIDIMNMLLDENNGFRVEADYLGFGT